MQTITPHDIRQTYDIIGPYLRWTPVVEFDLATPQGTSGTAPVLLKLEQLQRSGSFKVRGAFANLLTREIPPSGVVAASGGNHGVAVAHAAHRLGIPAQIFVPTISNPEKTDRIKRLRADLVVTGDRYADALAASELAAAASGALLVHAFDQYETVLGQGSLAIELAEQVPDLDTVVVPVGGGGLIAGIAAYFAETVRVIGVEPAGAPTLTHAREHGAPTDAPTDSIAADALAPRRVGDLTFPITEAHVNDVVLVEDQAIVQAQRTLWDQMRIIAEPAAAVGIAAHATGAYRIEPGERIAVVISGANTAARIG